MAGSDEMYRLMLEQIALIAVRQTTGFYRGRPSLEQADKTVLEDRKACYLLEKEAEKTDG